MRRVLAFERAISASKTLAYACRTRLSIPRLQNSPTCTSIKPFRAGPTGTSIRPFAVERRQPQLLSASLQDVDLVADLIDPFLEICHRDTFTHPGLVSQHQLEMALTAPAPAHAHRGVLRYHKRVHIGEKRTLGPHADLPFALILANAAAFAVHAVVPAHRGVLRQHKRVRRFRRLPRRKRRQRYAVRKSTPKTRLERGATGVGMTAASNIDKDRKRRLSSLSPDRCGGRFTRVVTFVGSVIAQVA